MQPEENPPISPTINIPHELTIGRYQVLQKLGSGSMGKVYKVYDPQLDRVVALKMLASVDSANVERFLREAKVIAKLHHPNIVSIYDISNDQTVIFFTMDFVEGQSLADFLKASSLSLRETIEIITKVGNAVQYAHSLGVVHRDLKPSNIMIGPDKEPKVMDFGIAKIANEDHTISRSGTIIGTIEYMSPEQATGKNEDVDERTDVYALGAILYEMLTGEPPFTGQSFWNIFCKVVEEPPTPISAIKPEIPKVLETACMKALEKDKRNRYPNIASFVEEIKTFSQEKVEKFTKPSKAHRSAKKEIAKKEKGKTNRSSKPLLVFASLSILLLSIIAYFFYSFTHTPGVKTDAKSKEIKGLEILHPTYSVQLLEPSIQENKPFEVSPSTRYIFVRGKIGGDGKVEQVILNARTADVDKDSREFSCEVSLESGTNAIELYILGQDHSWTYKAWKIVHAPTEAKKAKPEVFHELSDPSVRRQWEPIQKAIETFTRKKKKASIGLIREVLDLTIAFGAPVYDRGNHDLCYKFYANTSRSLCGAFQQNTSTEPARNALLAIESALNRCEEFKTPSEKAWTLRFAFDYSIMIWHSQYFHLQNFFKLEEQYRKRGMYKEVEESFRLMTEMLEELVFSSRQALLLEHPYRVIPLGFVESLCLSRKFKDASQTVVLGLKYAPELPQSGFSPMTFHIWPAQHAQILSELESIVQQNPQDTDILFLLGYEYYFTGKKDEAEKLLYKVQKLYPNHLGVRILLTKK